MDFDIPPSQRDQTLPMVLLMRGDEVIADEFTIDAEQAMEFLGIKRSRLTQISGRELRVGRIRRDRYIRPVYRESDLRDYLDWTRATATHISSSKAIEQAVESLDDRFSDILVVLQERLRQQKEEEQHWVKGELKQLRKSISQLIMAQETPPSQSLPGVMDKQSKRALHELQQRAHSLQDKLGDLAGRVDLFLPELRELYAAQKIFRRDIEGMFQAFNRMFELLSEDAEKGRNIQERERRELREDLSKQLEGLHAALPKPIVPRTPKRKPGTMRSYWLR